MIGINTGGSSTPWEIKNLQRQKLFSEVGFDGKIMEVRPRTGGNVKKCFVDLTKRTKSTAEMAERNINASEVINFTVMSLWKTMFS